jgi:hypothetical protein
MPDAEQLGFQAATAQRAKGLRREEWQCPQHGLTRLQVDLRLNWKQAASSLAAAVKEVGPRGEASLAVSDDKHEGAAASAVVLDAGGRVLDHKPTTVGEDA